MSFNFELNHTTTKTIKKLNKTRASYMINEESRNYLYPNWSKKILIYSYKFLLSQ